MSEIPENETILEIKKFLSFLYSFVDNPEDLNINITEGESSIIVVINTPHKLDTGRIIGKTGTTIKAIRTITINFVNAKFKKKIAISVVD